MNVTMNHSFLPDSHDRIGTLELIARTGGDLRRRKLLLMIIALIAQATFLPKALHAQLHLDYRPIQIEGQLPDILIEDLTLKSIEEMSNADFDAQDEEAQAFYLRSNLALKNAFLSGHVFIDDPMSEYLRTLVGYLLRDHPEFQDKINVYATRFPTANAFCWRNGTIFVNTALLRYLDNEAQLACILAHEIQHYILSHSVQSFQKERDLEEEVEAGADLDAEYENMRFSRHQEMEADSMGLQLYLDTDYHPHHAVTALQVLKEINGDDGPYPHLDLLDLLATPELEIDSSQLKFFSREADEEMEEEAEETSDASEEEDVDYSTHPDIDKRIEAVRRMLPEYDVTDTAAIEEGGFILPSERFYSTMLISTYETLELYYQKGMYAHSLYLGLRLAKDFPENQFVQGVIAQSVFWLIFHDQYLDVDEILPDPYSYKGYPFGDFVYFLKYVRSSKFEPILGAVLVHRATTFPDNPEIQIAYARYLLETGEKEEAQEKFDQFSQSFPDSRHANFARNKAETLK
ncbi:M48 family metalloprotease [Pontibacter sp. G13]|uniref:M48 family metalloprotease n=1 Tax=Pontibacter sp. G13 TaxID=3074898 RepID=UPI0028898328|nr:M48 family metalloprotease [Pontibacter sp. G13]WNJ20481.1 M48 family metalloprotease [Pontibacter sp. G13]